MTIQNLKKMCVKKNAQPRLGLAVFMHDVRLTSKSCKPNVLKWRKLCDGGANALPIGGISGARLGQNVTNIRMI